MIVMFEKRVEKALKVLKKSGKTGARNRFGETYTVVVWGLWHGWSNSVLARELGVHPTTAKRYAQKIFEDPREIFRLPVLHRGIRGGKTLWTCLLCGNEMKGSERLSREHVASHVTAREFIKMVGVNFNDQWE